MGIVAYQLVVFVSTLVCSLFLKRRAFYRVVVFWAAFTLINVFAPWLVAVQLMVLAAAVILGLKIADWKEKRAIRAQSPVSIPALVNPLTGRIFLVSTESFSLGAKDFIRILRKNGIHVFRQAKVLRSHGAEGLTRALDDLREGVRRGDILAIVRGGGDVTTPQFEAYRAKSACELLHALRASNGVLVVTGIGHSENEFPVDRVADFSAFTPTHAAMKICEWINGASRA